MSKTYNLLTKSALSIAFLIQLLVSISLACVFTVIYPNSAEHAIFDVFPSAPIWFGTLVGCASVCALIYVARFLPPKLTLLGSLTLFTVAGLYLISGNPAEIRADAYHTYLAAAGISSGDLSAFDVPNGYMSFYPHQMSLMWFYYLGHQFWDGTRWVYYANLVASLVTLTFFWATVRDVVAPYCVKVRIICLNLAALLPLIFLPNLFMLIFGYNQVISLSLFSGAIFAINRSFSTVDRYTYLWLFVGALFGIGAVLIRQNFLIGALAIGLLLAVYVLKYFNWVQLVFIPVFLLCAMTLPSAVSSLSQLALQVPHSTGNPTAVWIAMGLQDANVDQIDGVTSSSRRGGWYSNYPSAVFVKSGRDYSKMNRIAKEDIKNALQARWDSPDHGLKFFTTKAISSWGEPTYQSLFAGFVREQEPRFTSSFLNKLYLSDSCVKAYTAFMRGVVFSLFILSGMTTVRLIRRGLTITDFAPALCFVFLTGGFLFHLLWETKSLYIYPYVALLAIPASLAPICFSSESGNLFGDGFADKKHL